MFEESVRTERVFAQIPVLEFQSSQYDCVSEKIERNPQSGSLSFSPTNETITVLICDANELFLEGVKSVLQKESDIRIVGEARDGKECVELAQDSMADVVVMPTSMPGLTGLDAARIIKTTCLRTRIIFLGMQDDDDLLTRCLEAGASGVLLKDTPALQLPQAVRTVNNGERYIGPRVTTVNPEPPPKPLSAREVEILKWLAEGHAMKEIAARLFLSVKTVDSHRCNIMRKLDIRGRTALVRYALTNRLITG